jgi:aryl-alcohol dehydrogenase-like predicted oxidoreductase
LTGNIEPDSRFRRFAGGERDDERFHRSAFDRRDFNGGRKLKPIAAAENLSMAQLALAWVLRDERVSSAIIGASRPEQIDDNAAASGVTLSAETLAAIDEIIVPILPKAG